MTIVFFRVKVTGYVESAKLRDLIETNGYETCKQKCYAADDFRCDKRQEIIVSLFAGERLTIGQAFRKFQKIDRCGYSYKTFQRDIAQMVFNGMVKVEKGNYGRKGNTTIIEVLA